MLNWFSRHPWIFWILVIMLVFISALPIILKTSVTQGIYSYTKDYGIEKVVLDDIDLNPFTGTLRINNLQLFRAGMSDNTNDSQQESQDANNSTLPASEPTKNLTLATHIASLEVEIKMLELLKKRVYVERLFFNNANLPVSLNEDNEVSLAGIKILNTTPEQEKTAEESSGLPIDFALKSVDFAAIKVPVTFKNVITDINIKQLSLNNLTSWTDDFARLILHASVNNHDIRSNLQLHLFRAQPQVIGTLKTEGINTAEFTQFTPDLGFDLQTQLNADITFTASKTETGVDLFQQGEWSLNKLKLKQQQNTLTTNKVDWQGDLILKQSQPDKAADAKLDLLLDGKLSSKQVQLKQGEKQIQLASISSEGTTRIDMQQAISIALNQVLKASQLKIQDPAQELNLSTDVNLTSQAKVKLAGKKINITHQGSLKANNLDLAQKALSMTLKTLNSSGSAQVELNQNTEQSTGIKLQQKIQLDQIALQETEQQLSLNANASLNADSQIKMTKQSTEVNHQGDITVTDLQASTQSAEQNLLATLQTLNWKGQLNLNQTENIKLATQGAVNIENMALNNPKLKQAILSTQALKMDAVNLNEQQQLQVQNLNINGLTVGDENLKASHGLLTQLQNLGVNNIAVELPQTDQEAIDIKVGDVKLNGSETFITLDKDSEFLQLNQLLASLGVAKSDPVTKDSSANSSASDSNNKPTENQSIEANDTNPPKPIYSVNSLSVSGKNPILISANNLQPNITEQIDLTSFNLGKIDSQSPNQSSTYQIKVVFDEFSYLSSQGSVAVLNPVHALQAKTEVESFPLNNLSGLSEQSIGYVLNSGQLSADLTTELNQKKITAKNDVKIHKLELKPGESDIAKKQQANFSVPLETGIAMLQDKNDNIELSIPINGDTDNPNFNINDVINKALGKAMAGATRTYLLLALQPFGAIALAGEMALDKAGSIRLESIQFEPASTDITPKMQQYLAKLSGLLKERKAVSIKLCEGATQSERLLLTEQLIKADIQKQSQAGVKDIKVPDIKASDADLLALAAERQKQIKRALIKLGVAGKQVIFCNPKIQDSAQAEVKLKI